MANTLSTLDVKLTAENDKLKAKLTETTAALRKFQQQGSRSVQQFSKEFKTLVGALSVRELYQQFNSLAKGIDEIAKSSQQIGITTESLSGLQYAASLGGVAAGELNKALSVLAKNGVDAARGTGEAKDAFAAIGITAQQLKTLAPDQLLATIADKFSQYADGANKSAIAQKIFGEAGVKLIPFLNNGSKGIKELTDEAERLGIVLKSETAAQTEKFNDNMTRISGAVKGLGLAFADYLFPSLAELGDRMADATKQAGLFAGIVEGLKGGLVGLFTDELAPTEERIAKRLKELNKLGTDLIDPAKVGLGDGAKNQEANIRARIAVLNKEVDVLKAIRDLENSRTAANNGKGKQDAPLLQNATEVQKKAAEALKFQQEEAAHLRETLNEINGENQSYVDYLREQAKQWADLADPVEKYRVQLQQVQDALDLGLTNADAAKERRFQINEQIDKLYETNEVLKEQKSIAEELGLTFESAFEKAILGGEKFSDVLKAVAKDIAAILIRKNVTEPAGEFFKDIFKGVNLFGGSSGSSGNPLNVLSGSALSDLFDGFASGTSSAPGGLAIVGERGPELVNLPRGSQVIPNNQLGSVGGISISVDARGSTDPAGTEAAVKRAVRESISQIRSMKTRGQLPEFA